MLLNVGIGLVMAFFALAGLLMIGFMSYSFGHWMHQIYMWFHGRRLARVGQAGMATLVAKRSAVLTPRGGPLMLVVTLEMKSPDGIVHRRELTKNADVANMPEVGSRFPVYYDPAHPDDFTMPGTWIRQT